jgi:hypothetical protein
MMHGEERIEQVAPKGAESSEYSILVCARKPRVADDVSDQDRGQFPHLAHGANAEVARLLVAGGLSMAALPCCTKEDVEAGNAGPACRLASLSTPG